MDGLNKSSHPYVMGSPSSGSSWPFFSLCLKCEGLKWDALPQRRQQKCFTQEHWYFPISACNTAVKNPGVVFSFFRVAFHYQTEVSCYLTHLCPLSSKVWDSSLNISLCCRSPRIQLSLVYLVSPPLPYTGKKWDKKESEEHRQQIPKEFRKVTQHPREDWATVLNCAL